MVPPWVAGFVGLPYQPGGRTRDGLDCWGLLRLVWTDHYGWAVPDYPGPAWTRSADHAAVGAAADQHAALFDHVLPEAAQPGDGMLIRMRGLPVHVGLLVAMGWMLHIEEGCDSTIERLSSPMWQRRILGFYRPRGAGQVAGP